MPKSIYTQLISLSWVYHGHLQPSYPASSGVLAGGGDHGPPSEDFLVGARPQTERQNRAKRN